MALRCIRTIFYPIQELPVGYEKVYRLIGLIVSIITSAL